VRGVFGLTEEWEMKRQSTYEAEALKLIDDGNQAAAVRVLQQFIDENCGRVEKEYKMLNTTLPMMLETVGIKYVFTDYLKDWSSKKGVPLPIP